MKKILEGSSRRVDTIFNEVDTNFIEVCNALLRIAYPDYTIKGYADASAEPAAVPGDCYLVTAAGTVWGIVVEKNDVLHYTEVGSASGSGSGSASGSGTGGEDWEVLPYKITEINAAQQVTDSHILRGRIVYHEQFPGQDTAGDWRQYADADNFYTQRCETGNAVQGEGEWVTKFTFIS